MTDPAQTAAVFISFRNKDGEHAAAVLRNALAAHFGESVVFRSTDSIEPGTDYRHAILGSLEGCAVCIAVIGPHWSDMRGADGERRLFRHDDWVRTELSLALSLGKRVVPVLLDQVPRLGERELPPDLEALAGLQSLRMTHYDHGSAVRRLIRILTPLPGHAARPPVCRLPPAEADVVERPDPATRLEAALAAARARAAVTGAAVPVLVRGAVGTGKSVFVAEYARRTAGRAAVWWIDAREPRAIGAQLADLAAAAGLPEWDAATGLSELFDRLGRDGRWLLVFDGVDGSAGAGALLDLLTRCGPGGDVLVTTRLPDWGLAAVEPCPVDLFTRAESVALLTAHLPGRNPAVLDRLAAAMDDLPLAVAHAAALVKAGWFVAEDLPGRLAAAPGAVLASPSSQRHRGVASVIGAWTPVVDRIEAEYAAGRRVLGLLGVLASAAVPLRLFTERPEDAITTMEAAVAIADSGLVPVRAGAFHAHPLLRSFIRERIGPEAIAGSREAARVLLAAFDPGDPRALQAAGGYEAILPHAFALDLAASPEPACRELLLRVAHHLTVRGDAGTALDVATSAYERWLAESGPRDPHVLGAAAEIARALFRSGDPAGAARIDRRLVDAYAEAGGPDGTATLRAELDLATDLWVCGEHESATASFERLAARLAARFGPESWQTLRAVHNAAHGERSLGRAERAFRMDEPNLRVLTRVFGRGHPDTLRSAHAVGLDLRALGDVRGALALHQDTYERLVELHGPEHADPLAAHYAVAVDLRLLRDPRLTETAREVYERSLAGLGPDHPDTLTRRLFYGEVLRTAGFEERGAAERAAARRGLSARSGLRPGRVVGGLLGGWRRSDEEP
ncbi:FxSxx-COOH system tetratricopeptide repeat protein [Actinospica sp.]|uniref:FxSxx-COOH system tetratricopeptide repeat protein n=1 Tax=Actinospica sp. TaxID=1872142 RepID=UPI002C75D66D|nr:FxSxx-COOH system tetratricopeptide repeat protein [Actinospica sp.]HWG28503.1 FxSxx-COOH system tetratricopeptide repeat protein [Actinospica sp.]